MVVEVPFEGAKTRQHSAAIVEADEAGRAGAAASDEARSVRVERADAGLPIHREQVGGQRLGYGKRRGEWKRTNLRGATDAGGRERAALHGVAGRVENAVGGDVETEHARERAHQCRRATLPADTGCLGSAIVITAPAMRNRRIRIDACRATRKPSRAAVERAAARRRPACTHGSAARRDRATARADGSAVRTNDTAARANACAATVRSARRVAADAAFAQHAAALVASTVTTPGDLYSAAGANAYATASARLCFSAKRARATRSAPSAGTGTARNASRTRFAVRTLGPIAGDPQDPNRKQRRTRPKSHDVRDIAHPEPCRGKLRRISGLR